jgi:hypothetical protein
MNRSDFATKMASVSVWGQAVALCWIVDAIVRLPLALDDDWFLATFVSGIPAVLGVLLLLSSRAFGKGARTDDDDHRHLVSGFRFLRVYFAIQAVPFAFALLFTTLFVLPHAFGR